MNRQRLNAFKFNRLEFAGSLGDLGTLVPLSVALITINDLGFTPIFLMVGLFYIITGGYHRIPIPVQPLKVVAAIAIAFPDKITLQVMSATGILFGIILLLLSLTGLIDHIARLFTRPIVRGIQLGLGFILMVKGIALVSDPAVFLHSAGSDVTGSIIPFNLIIGIAGFLTGLIAAMPMCHGAGGLAAHYRFGARTGGSNLMIGAIFIVMALLLGKTGISIFSTIPTSVLGVLLMFAGLELALIIRDLETKKEFFIAFLIAGMAVATKNMGIAFVLGIIVAKVLTLDRVNI